MREEYAGSLFQVRRIDDIRRDLRSSPRVSRRTRFVGASLCKYPLLPHAPHRLVKATHCVCQPGWLRWAHVRKERVWVGKFSRLGKMVAKSLDGTPNQFAKVAPY